ncbi:MAG: Bro-N domain-containing protein [Bombella apis]|uniref:BRO-N domain-containing protein n=1 Tax=Bombella apis TaxID=1785988 RepID=UPI0023F41F69|nr:Bro-N domain-containing protein [Bombella apis]MCT6819482.1 Bro-N domain-containing protein [Bombella apis]
MAGREYTGYNRTNKDQLPLSTLPIPPKPASNAALIKQMENLSTLLHQRNLNNAIHLAIEAAQGRGTLIDYFAEMGRRFGTRTAPQEETAAMLPFSFEGHPVRVIGQNDEPWWVLTDSCEVLNIRNNRDAASRLDTDEKTDVGIPDTSSTGVTQHRKVTIINESGL